MKKVTSILLTLTIIMTSFSIVFAAETQFSSKIDKNGLEITSIVEPRELQFLGLGYITENGVNLRSGPGTNYASLGSLAKYDNIAVYSDMTRDTIFAYVDVETGKNKGKSGWVHPDYISITNPASLPYTNN